MDSLISRQKAIDALCSECQGRCIPCDNYPCGEVKAIEVLPSAQPTLYGYNVEHLILIAEVLRKENMPPERVAEALTDIGRIVAIVRDEFEETLRKSVEQSLPVGSSI